MDTLGNDQASKTSKNEQLNFYCEKCDYTCCKKYNWDRHLSASKHTKETVGYALETTNELNIFSCENCDKKFKNRSGLWKHKKKCISDDNSNTIIKADPDVDL